MKNNEKYIDQQGITIITPIDPAKDIKGLYSLLNKIGGDINNNSIIDFRQMKTIHYARWFIMDLAKDASGNLVPPNLVYSGNFDGSVEDHLEELLRVSGDGIKDIYSYCKGFPTADNASNQNIFEYWKAHVYNNQLFWPAIRGGTVEQIRGEGELRDAIQEFLNRQAAGGGFKDLDPAGIHGKIKDFIASKEEFKWALQARAKPSFGWKLDYYGRLVGRLLLVVILLPVILLFLLPVWWLILSRIFEKKDDKNRKDISRSKEFDALLRNEDQVFQNQLTIYGAIKKPYWYRLTTLKMGLWIFATNGKYRSDKGKLSGIETIHFARWTLFNKGKNVMFFSNYDGAWEIYLSEFIDRSAAAMNLTFGTTVGYPQVKFLLWKGAFDEQAFKTVVRNNQYPCQVWYSAYPYLTVKNILNNHQIRKGLDGSSEESTADWLKRF